MPGIFVAQLPQRCDLQESFDGRWAEPLYNILIREVRGLVPPYSRQRSIESRHSPRLHTPTMEHCTYNNGSMQAAGGGAVTCWTTAFYVHSIEVRHCGLLSLS